MSRWYQHMLTGEQAEVKTLEEDDYYVENASTWSRISSPAPPEPEPEPEPVLEVAEPEPEPAKAKARPTKAKAK